MKNPPDPSYSAEHADECCMSCGARLEEGDHGRCNRCGGDFNRGRKKTAAWISKIAATNSRENWRFQIRNLAKVAAADCRRVR